MVYVFVKPYLKFFLFTEADPEAIPHDTYMRVESKNGLVINKPRIITHEQQPTSHTCMLNMNYILQASGAGKYLVQYSLLKRLFIIMLKLSVV